MNKKWHWSNLRPLPILFLSESYGSVVRSVCRCVEEPRFTFQIENTYSGDVRFDDNGLPLSDREGHGYGVRSVAAFCRKVHAFVMIRKKTSV